MSSRPRTGSSTSGPRAATRAGVSSPPAPPRTSRGSRRPTPASSSGRSWPDGRPMRRTKVICTIGPASSSTQMLDRLVAAGMDVARLNFSHGSHAEHAAVIQRLRAGEARWGRPVTILQDLQGPKVRLGTFEAGRVDLRTGAPFALCRRPQVGDASRASVNHPDYLGAAKPGDEIWMDDGMIRLRVEAVVPDEVRCRVTAGGIVSDHKGIFLAGVPISESCLTAKDKADLRFGIEAGVDFVAISYVRSGADIEQVQAFLRDEGASVPIVAKLERAEMVANLPGILSRVDAAMVARGDLGLEVPLEEVPLIQKEVIQEARLARVPVIIATQMLESMIGHVRPTRAEVSDVANAIFDGADAIMLSAETATGGYPAEAVQTMARIAERAEGAVRSPEPARRRPAVVGFPEAISDAARHAGRGPQGGRPARGGPAARGRRAVGRPAGLDTRRGRQDGRERARRVPGARRASPGRPLVRADYRPSGRWDRIRSEPEPPTAVGPRREPPCPTSPSCSTAPAPLRRSRSTGPTPTTP